MNIALSTVAYENSGEECQTLLLAERLLPWQSAGGNEEATVNSPALNAKKFSFPGKSKSTNSLPFAVPDKSSQSRDQNICASEQGNVMKPANFRALGSADY
jgi:hypothetical protein